MFVVLEAIVVIRWYPTVVIRVRRAHVCPLCPSCVLCSVFVVRVVVCDMICVCCGSSPSFLSRKRSVAVRRVGGLCQRAAIVGTLTRSGQPVGERNIWDQGIVQYQGDCVFADVMSIVTVTIGVEGSAR